MKKYLIQQTIEAEPMCRTDAEAKMGHEASCHSREDDGFLTCDMQTLKFDWVNESNFKGVVFDTPIERMFYLHDKLPEWRALFNGFTKNNPKLSNNERLQAYLINRHLKAIDVALQKILNVNVLNSTNL